MESLLPIGGWVDGHFDIFDILLKPPQPFTGLFLYQFLIMKIMFCVAHILTGQRLWTEPPKFVDTIAEGIRTQQCGQLTFPILVDYIEKDVFTVVSNSQIKIQYFLDLRNYVATQLSYLLFNFIYLSCFRLIKK